MPEFLEVDVQTKISNVKHVLSLNDIKPIHDAAYKNPGVLKILDEYQRADSIGAAAEILEKIGRKEDVNKLKFSSRYKIYT